MCTLRFLLLSFSPPSLHHSFFFFFFFYKTTHSPTSSFSTCPSSTFLSSHTFLTHLSPLHLPSPPTTLFTPTSFSTTLSLRHTTSPQGQDRRPHLSLSPPSLDSFPTFLSHRSHSTLHYNHGHLLQQKLRILRQEHCEHREHCQQQLLRRSHWYAL